MDKHYERLKHHRKSGFAPKVIYDIGANQGDWTKQIRPLFPEAQFYLFEADENNASSLKDYPHFIALLGDEEKTATYYCGGCGTGNSVFRERTEYFADERVEKRELPMQKLRSVVEKNNLPMPDLIKMDVQGAENIIIQGSPEIVSHAQLILMECKILEYNAGAPLLQKTVELMDTLGYRMFDFLGLNYLPCGALVEVDVLFAKNSSALVRQAGSRYINPSKT